MSFARETSEGVYLSIKVQPRASRNQIAGLLGTELKVLVRAPPVDSAANEALIEYMAEVLGVPRSRVQITKGLTSRHKTLFINGLKTALIEAVLTPGK